jgi:hypothetical protein
VTSADSPGAHRDAGRRGPDDLGVQVADVDALDTHRAQELEAFEVSQDDRRLVVRVPTEQLVDVDVVVALDFIEELR